VGSETGTTIIHRGLNFGNTQYGRRNSRVIAHTITDVKSGRTDPRIGTALAYMASALLKAIEIEELEVRIERLQSKRSLDLLGIGGNDQENGQHNEKV
jgi:hypothetical protein